jgi:hypothetical protein
MDLGEILRVMRDRWYVVVPMLMLAIGLGAAAVFVVPNTYQSYSTVSLLSSPISTTVATQGNDNPFLTFDASLVATADFLGRSLQSTDAAKQLKDLGVTEKYTVALADGAQGPFITFTVTGNDETHVLRSTGTLTQFAAQRLSQIQQNNGVKTQDMIRMTEIIPPQAPELQMKKKIEVVLAVSGGTTALALLLTFVLESISRSRARKREREPGPLLASATSGRPVPAVPVSPAIVLPQPRIAKVQPMQAERAIDQTVVLDIPTKVSYVDPDRRSVADQTETELFLIGPSGPVAATGKGTAKGKASSVPGSNSSAGTYRSSGVSDLKGQEDAGSANGR